VQSSAFDLAALTAIDAHVHAEAHGDHGDVGAAAARYFGAEDTPGDLDGLAAYYRERRMAAVLFTVDEHLTDRGMVPNDDVLAAAARHPDVLIPFVSVDPTRGTAALAEVDRLLATGAVRGFKLHPPLMRFSPDDRAVYPFYERVEAARLPLIFHTGHSGIGTGVRGGGGIRLKYGNPLPIDDVAVDFPDLPIVLAHPSFPWQDEAISICLHKPNVFIDLSGWSPKYFSPTLVQYANTLLREKVLFGSDYPLITPDRWLRDFAALPIRDEVRPLILKENAARLLGLA
jgi:predicted TIM-barrel fold metal-dependent hydrolase